MKTITVALTTAAIAVTTGMVLLKARTGSVKSPPLPLAESHAPATVQGPSSQAKNDPPPLRPRASTSASTGSQQLQMPRSAQAASAIPSRPVDRLLDPQTSFQQRQEAWKELLDTGKMDEAIAELERRVKDDPANPLAPACLGQAYLQKAGSIQDIREQGILGMKADQTFDTALNLDAQNWDARFWKATALSYWPPQLGKSVEVMQHLVTLVEQQEKGAPRPEYARTYLLLGEQYQKSGHTDYAQQTWQRGGRIFPNDDALKERLAGIQ